MPKIPIPQSGWHAVGLTDLDFVDPSCTRRLKCDRCNHRLRYVHHLEHPKRSKRLGVGACCAVQLATGYKAKDLEYETAKRTARLLRFLNPTQWRHNPAKGSLTRKRKGTRVTVFPQHGGYVYVFDKNFSPRAYATQTEAQIAAFEAMDPAPTVTNA